MSTLVSSSSLKILSYLFIAIYTAGASTGVFAMEDLPSMSMVACHLGRHTLHAQVRGRIDADQTSGRRARWLTLRAHAVTIHDRVSSPDPFRASRPVSGRLGRRQRCLCDPQGRIRGRSVTALSSRLWRPVSRVIGDRGHTEPRRAAPIPEFSRSAAPAGRSLLDAGQQLGLGGPAAAAVMAHAVQAAGE